MKILTVFMLCGFSILMGCTKDQRTVRKIDGRWEIIKVSGMDIPENYRHTYTFFNCKLIQDEYCEVRYQAANGAISKFRYRILNKGKQLEFVPLYSQNPSVVYEILTINSNELRMRHNTDSTSIDYEYRKLF